MTGKHSGAWRVLRLVTLIVPWLVASSCSTTAAAGGGALQPGAHVLKWDMPGTGSSPMSTAPVNTQPTGSTFVLFLGYHGVEFGSVSDNKGNKYTQFGTPIMYSKSPGYYLAAFICAGCAGGAGHVFSFNKLAGFETDEATLFAVEVGGSPSIDAFAAADSFANPISAGSVTTTRQGDLLLLAALGDSYSAPDNYTASAGFALLDQNTFGTNSMAGADAYEMVGAPGTYSGTLRSSLTDPTGGSAAFLLALKSTAPAHVPALPPVATAILALGLAAAGAAWRRAPSSKSLAQ